MTLNLFLEAPYQKSFEATIDAVEGNAIILNQTGFYATSGGQPGDIGTLRFANDDTPIIVAATVKDRENADRILHIAPENTDLSRLTPGTVITGEIDWPWRHNNMRMHTALHLLCSLIEGDVTGGQIGSAKSRLDFNIESGSINKEELTQKINELIEQDHPISEEWISEEELNNNPSLVRTLSVKPPSGSGRIRLVRIGSKENTIDLQPCGGTHVRSTAEIGKVIVSKIENKGRMNKRISIYFDD